MSTAFTILPLTRLLIGSEHSNHLCKSFALAMRLTPTFVYASAIIWLALATVIGSPIKMFYTIILAIFCSVSKSLSLLIKASFMFFFV